MEEITVEGLQSQLFIATKRFETLSQSTALSPQDVMKELAATVLPALSDCAVLLDRVEQGVVYAQEECDRLAEVVDEGGGGDSQLRPEHALRFTNYLEAVVDMSESSLKGLDPTSDQAKALTLTAGEGRELIKLVNELTLVGGDEDDDEDDDEEDQPDDDGERPNGADA